MTDERSQILRDSRVDKERPAVVNQEREMPTEAPARRRGPAPTDDDPYAHLTPSERFTNAIERRDALIERRTRESRDAGRRAADPPLKR